MNVVTLLIALNYIFSNKGEKQFWFEGHLYRHQRENQYRCIQKDCNGRFNTVKNSKGEDEICEDRHPHCCQSIKFEELLCKNALNRMKERVKDELHTALIGIYIKSYFHYKSTFMKMRKGLKPAIPHDLNDLNFEGDNVKYTLTTDKMPFLRQYCRDPGSNFLFFASNEGTLFERV